MMSLPELLSRALSFARGGRSNDARCRVLFVCMGNVCRSPTAEAVFRHQLEAAGLAEAVQCASAGTHDFNVGRAPDGRARAVAARRGYALGRRRGRQIEDGDFARYDLILAMDRQNLDSLRERCPPEHRDRILLLMAFARRHAAQEIPDPYFSNAKGFELVLDMIEDACATLLEHVRSNYIAEPDRRTAPGER